VLLPLEVQQHLDAAEQRVARTIDMDGWTCCVTATCCVLCLQMVDAPCLTKTWVAICAQATCHENSLLNWHVALTACGDVTPQNWHARGIFPRKSRGHFLTTPAADDNSTSSKRVLVCAADLHHASAGAIGHNYP